jgi:DUF438 domain-containing protein
MRFDRMDDEMLRAVIEALPGEITIIDANDEVVGWNRHETRRFRRPLTCMGLNFRRCHPEESLPLIEKLVDELRSGQKDSAHFWFDAAMPPDTKKHKILVEFRALRDSAGKYLGCMEWAEDIEYIRGLEGEKRLLDVR